MNTRKYLFFAASKVIPAKRLCHNVVAGLCPGHTVDFKGGHREPPLHKTYCDTVWKAGIHLVSPDPRVKPEDDRDFLGIIRKKFYFAGNLIVLAFFIVVLMSGCGGSGTPSSNIPSPVSHIRASSPSSGGLVRITGEAGAANAGSTVTILNTTTSVTYPSIGNLKDSSGEVFLMPKATANADGSFQQEVSASAGDILRISRTSNGVATNALFTVPSDVPPLPLTAANVVDMVYNPTTGEAIILGNNGTDGFLYFYNVGSGAITTVTLTGLSAAAVFTLNVTSQILAIVDDDDVNNVYHYNIAAGTTTQVSTGGTTAYGVSAPPAMAGYAVLANTATTPSLSYYNLVAGSVTAMGNITSGATTQTGAVQVSVDNNGANDMAAVMSLMSDGTYLLSINQITPATPASTQLTGDTLAGMTAAPKGIIFYNTASEVLVTDGANDRVFHIIIGTATITTIAVGDNPKGVAVNSADTTAYVVNYDGQSVSTINIATETVTATTTVGLSPIAVVTDSTGAIATVIILNSGDNTLTLM